MIRQTLSHFPHGTLSGVAMFLFMGVFFGAIAWIYRRDSKTHYDRLARSVFNEKEGTSHE